MISESQGDILSSIRDCVNHALEQSRGKYPDTEPPHVDSTIYKTHAEGLLAVDVKLSYGLIHREDVLLLFEELKRISVQLDAFYAVSKDRLGFNLVYDPKIGVEMK